MPMELQPANLSPYVKQYDKTKKFKYITQEITELPPRVFYIEA